MLHPAILSQRGKTKQRDGGRKPVKQSGEGETGKNDIYIYRFITLVIYDDYG